MSFKEVTQSVERMEMLEERLGIRVQGLMAMVDDRLSSTGEHKLTVNGEIYSTSGGSLDGFVAVRIIAQNEKGQVVGKASVSLSPNRFVGYTAFSEICYCAAFPTRIKILPERF
jgi:hypothetical protein